jgi:two-component system, OmpR family, KDP operon response regulator KdpE
LTVRGPSVLVADDDPAVRLLLRRELTAAGYRVQAVEPSQRALRSITERQFDLLILDIDAAAAGGLEAIRIAREMSTVPILALSVRADEDATIEALEKGADDYVRKPFGVKELLARVKNVLRRRTREQGKPALLVTGDLEIDLLYRRVRLRGQEVHLPVKLYEVLRVLAEGVGRVRTREEILRAVWGARRAERIEYLRSAIRELRRKLEADPAHPRYIVTEMGVGYRLELLS